MFNQVKVLSTRESEVWLTTSDVVDSIIDDADLAPNDMVSLIATYARLCGTGIILDAGAIERYVSENR